MDGFAARVGIATIRPERLENAVGLCCHGSRVVRKTPARPSRPWTLAAGKKVFAMQKVTVRVPGSTSNLGPGFDCLGVALRIHNSITVIQSKSRSSHPRIVLEAADQFFKQTKRRAFPFSCSITEQVPRCRGLGASATVRLGILLALNRLSGDPLRRLAVFRLCAELEGHPDNAAPASFGGFTVARSARGAGRTPQHSLPAVQRFDVASRVYFVLLVPDLEIETKRARRILPSRISRIAAVENCANACVVTAAFASQRYEKLSATFIDHLHQPFRLRLIPFLPRVIAAAENAGAIGAFLSGSGSTIAAVTLRRPEKIAAAMLRAARSPARTLITHADNRGAQILSR
jgi:homoserine kinase